MKIQTRKRRNVMWMRMTVPATDPMFKDQDMKNALRDAASGRYVRVPR
jgi:hypothetical protein